MTDLSQSVSRLLRTTGLGACWLALVGLTAPSQAAEPTLQTPSAAQRSAEQGPRWGTLKPSEQQALAPLQKEWASIGLERKKKWLEVATRFPSMSAAERERIQERMAEWARLSPEERGRARLQFQEVRQLSPQDRQQQWEAYQALPEQQRKALAAKAGDEAVRGTAASRPQAATSSDARASAPTQKQNLVKSPSHSGSVKSVEPTVVQAKPGATTTLVSKPAAPPAHHQPGQPKIAATKAYVDPNTLLPTRGPQAAVAAASMPAASESGSPAQ